MPLTCLLLARGRGLAARFALGLLLGSTLFPRASLAEGPSPTDREVSGRRTSVRAVTIGNRDLETVRVAARTTDRVVVRSLPVDAEQSVDLELIPFAITTPDTRLVVVGADGTTRDLDFDPSSVVLLRGHVAGEPDSRVFLAIGPSTARGRIDRGTKGTYSIGRRPAGDETGQASLVAVPDAAGSLGRADCGLDDPSTGGVAFLGLEPTVPPGRIRQIELALDTDYEYFSLFGNADDAAAYLVELYGAVSDIFIRDVRSTFLVTFIRLWETPDDLFNQENPLNAFREHWNDNMDDVPRDTAQLVSGRRDMPFGGIAFVNVLCSQNFAYSAIGYVLGEFADPTRSHPFNRDISLAAHELAHVVAVPHTHSPSFDIDSCDDPTTAPQRGTIMSYCGQTFTGGAANLDLRFHAIMSQVMRSRVAQSACLGDDCNLNGTEDADDIAAETSADANSDGIPDECQDCNGNGVLDPLDVLEGPSLDLNLNGVPDECEPDCNGNGVPDDSDLADPPTSVDAYGNGVPDECEDDCNGDGVSDYTEIQQDMTLDLDRDARLDACQDCDGDETPDLVELAGANNIWVADLTQPGLRQYLWLTGTESATSDAAALSEPQDVLALPDGRVLVTSAGDDRIVEFSAGGALIGDFVDGAGGLLEAPAAMTLAPGGDLLVVNRGADSVVRFGPDGTSRGEFVGRGAGGLTAPFGLVFGPDGDLYVTSEDGRVLRYDGATGGFLGELVTADDNGGLSEPRGLAFLPVSGDLLVASRGSNAVLRYDGVTGVFLGQFNRNGTDTVMTLDQPWCIRIGIDGGVYVSRAHDHDLGGESGVAAFNGAGTPDGTARLHLTNARIYQFDPESGNMIRAYVQGLNSQIEHPSGFDFLPSAIGDEAADCNGNLVPDACDIAAGTSLDRNGDGVPDECPAPPPCVGDADGSGVVDVDDLVLVILRWGTDDAAADVDGSGGVDVDDLVTVVLNWGKCG